MSVGEGATESSGGSVVGAVAAPCSVMDEECPVQSSMNLHNVSLHSNELQVNGEGALPRRDDGATVMLRWISVQLELTNCLLRHGASLTVSSTCKH